MMYISCVQGCMATTEEPAEQRPGLISVAPRHTLFISNLPYHVHASAIQDMLDSKDLAYVRARPGSLLIGIHLCQS
jgi:hypothetical protein